jgi:hypothetical protein
MKYNTTTIVRALRNSTTPAACLAAWQNNGTRRNLATLRKEQSKTYNAGKTIPELRAQRLKYTARPEMSSPEADAPLLWLAGESDREIKNCWAGREFLDHGGWYTMDDSFGETIETYAVQLHRFPKLIFYATKEDNDNFCLHLQEWEEIDFSDCQSEYDAGSATEDAARSLIRSYDSTTENNAEEHREFYEQDQREQEIVQNKEELKTVRESARRLIAELRELCPALGEKYPAAQEAVQRTLRGLLRERRDLIARNEKLANA